MFDFWPFYRYRLLTSWSGLLSTGLISQTFHQYAPLSEKKWKIGNTGNILFLSALQNILDCVLVAHGDIEKIKQLDAIVVTDLIWLRQVDEPTEYLNNWLDLDVRIVPISIGLQAHTFDPSFKIQPTMVSYLAALQERSVLAVRGQYTADILNKHGVTNIEIVGCPSVYQLPLYQRSFESLNGDRDVSYAVANHRTLYGELSSNEIAFLHYARANGCDFIEQTFLPLSETNVSDPELLAWMEHRSYLFFDQEAWLRHMQRYTFSLGLRFHGNVSALLAGLPALFMTIDSRTREMTEFFNLPQIAFDDFDSDKPMEHYRSLADYSSFGSTYPSKLTKFISYLKKNGLPLRAEYADSLSRFQPIK